MGMRATFAHVDLNGVLNMVSVQWSTMIDQNLSIALKDHDAPDKALSRVFKKVTTSYDHISALDMESKRYDGSDNDPVCYGLYVSGGFVETNPQYAYPSRFTASVVEKKGGYIKMVNNYHTQDGLSVIVNQRDPWNIMFGWDDDNGIKWQTVKVVDLVEGGKKKGGFKSDYHNR